VNTDGVEGEPRLTAPFRIIAPHEGDVLTRHDGKESAEGITVTVRGAAPAGAAVRVNGVAAAREGDRFSCEVLLTSKRNWIRAECADTRDEIFVLWNKDSRKRYRFSVDDNIEFLNDLGLSPASFPSLFAHWYLKFWRAMHREFGAKIHLNIYYQTEGFDLTQMPACWRKEWEENASWLHLSFHALQDKPDRPYRHATYAQMAHDFDLVCGHIRRFAGNAVLGNTTTVHWAECPKEAALALRDRGIENLVALFDVQGYEGECTTGYYLSREQCAYCDTRGAWHDRETGLTFVRCTSVINTVELDSVERALETRTSTPATGEMLELLIHEQYFRRESAYYQESVLEKVRTALRWVTERGYAPVFWSDGFLGTPERLASE